MKSIIVACSIILLFSGCSNPAEPPKTAADIYAGTYNRANATWSRVPGRFLGHGVMSVAPTQLVLNKDGSFSMRLEIIDDLPTPPAHYSVERTGTYVCTTSTYHPSSQNNLSYWSGTLVFSPTGQQGWTSHFSIWDPYGPALTLPSTFALQDSGYLNVESWTR